MKMRNQQHSFFYENNFIRIKPLILEKNYEQAKSKVRLPVAQNIRAKCLGWLFLK